MKSKWEARCVTVVPKAIHPDKFDQRIAEVAEILYDLFRQLERSENLPEPIETGLSPSDFTSLEQRTGTHG